VWGPPGDLVVARDNSEQVIHGESPVTLHRSIVEHDTLRTPGSLASVLAPGL
jgi:hypothetical protein